MAIFEQEHGRDTVEVAKTLHWLGVAHGETQAAVRELERARGIFAREYGSAHPEVEAIFIDYSSLYQWPRTADEDAAFGRALKAMA